jgi:hypothetical protein
MLEQVVTPARHRGHHRAPCPTATTTWRPCWNVMQQKIDDRQGRHHQTPKLRERQLTDLGIAEANHYGWNDTYTLTKWMGEQYAMEGMQGSHHDHRASLPSLRAPCKSRCPAGLKASRWPTPSSWPTPVAKPPCLPSQARRGHRHRARRPGGQQHPDGHGRGPDRPGPAPHLPSLHRLQPTPFCWAT